jgi:hypothetical protein
MPAGTDLNLGLRLPALHAQAGIGVRDGTDVAGQLGPLAAAAGKWESLFRSIVPSALALGVSTREHSEHWLAEFVRDTAAGGVHMSLWPLLIGTWKRKPG